MGPREIAWPQYLPRNDTAASLTPPARFRRSTSRQPFVSRPTTSLTFVLSDLFFVPRRRNPKGARIPSQPSSAKQPRGGRKDVCTEEADRHWPRRGQEAQGGGGGRRRRDLHQARDEDESPHGPALLSEVGGTRATVGRPSNDCSYGGNLALSPKTFKICLELSPSCKVIICLVRLYLALFGCFLNLFNFEIERKPERCVSFNVEWITDVTNNYRAGHLRLFDIFL